MNDRNRSEMDDLLGAFALDAVDPAERDMVERHLARDPVARAQVDEMRETAAVLASLPVGDEGAPEGLWDHIASAISPDAGLPHESRAEEADVERVSPDVVPLTRAKRFAAVPTRLAVPVAAAAALVIAVLAVQVATRPSNRVGDIAAAYNHAVANGAVTVELHRSGNGPVAARIALQRDGSGYLRNARLGPLPAGKTYQLWALVGSAKQQLAISAGVLGPQPGAAAFHVAGRPDAFAITVEDAPGVVRPTKAPEAVGNVRSIQA
jgi:hypothetical protein